MHNTISRDARATLFRITRALFGREPDACDNGFKLLLVRVNSSDADLVLSAISGQGSVVTHSSEELVLDELGRVGYDVVLIGHDAGIFDAARFCSYLKRQMVTTPLLVLTGYDLSATIACLDAGADRCLADGVSADEMMAHIRALVRRNREQWPTSR